MILLIDNYDSFVFNLARYFERLGQETRVVRNDTVSVDDIRALGPAAIVISPGPGTPENAGCSLDTVRSLAGDVPILGICLGHQVIAAAFGGRIVRASEPVHGRTSNVLHTGDGLFARLPNPLSGCRYHSLVIEPATLPESFDVTGWTEEGTIMAIEHHRWPIVGLQFHPESILTDEGFELLAGFLRLADIPFVEPVPSIASERAEIAESNVEQ